MNRAQFATTRRSQAGFTLAEILGVIAIGGLLLTMATTTVNWIGREESRSAVYLLQTELQAARMQAISRHRTCRFNVDTSTRRVTVIDLNDPSISTDDITVADITLSSRISFARPDGSTPVTLNLLSGTTYQATFSSDGAVALGPGLISIFAGDRYEQLTLYGAGGIQLARWNGSAWKVGA